MRILNSGTAFPPRLAMVFTLIFSWGIVRADNEGEDVKELSERANALAQRALIVDGHVDMPYRLQESWADVTTSAPDRNFDYMRAHFGGLNVPFMSVYTPADMEEAGGSFLLANQLIDSVEALVARAPGKFSMAYSTAQVEQAFSQGMIALALGMENGSPIEGKLENVAHFHARGVRYITLAHSLANHISDSSYDENRPWEGLSPFGLEVISEMNRLGIMVDVSHLSDEAFYDVLEATEVPVIASHSSVRHFTPGFERNMDDEMIKALAENGGVIMINFGSSFLTKAANEWYVTLASERAAWAEETGNLTSGPEADQWVADYRAGNPLPFASVSDVADHFDHAVSLVGTAHVGVGSDYDGVGDSLPVGLKDVSDYPNLVAELLRRGYSEADIVAILGGNVMRVWKAVEAHAASAND